MSDATQPILKAEHLGITFGGLKAVSNFNMTINKGEPACTSPPKASSGWTEPG